MDLFQHVNFKGTFRTYQQRILDNADKYLSDGKINIVAAPGSGKTILGLELIKRLKAPCIILSPTTAIRQQWGERFRDAFLDDPNEFDSLFSNDLHEIKLINSITYQALYSIIEKKSIDEDDEKKDYSDIDIINDINKNNIKTICLDEAHHLKNEWQKSLEKFLKMLDKNVKIISLTATPPYDSEGKEWDRFTQTVGTIDEEIFIPELVAQDTLCPHQDYVYFNYPSKDEEKVFLSFKEQSNNSLKELNESKVILNAYYRVNNQTDYEVLFSFPKEHVALLELFDYFNFDVSKRLIRELTNKSNLPKFNLSFAEIGLQFLLTSDLYLNDEEKEEILKILKQHSNYEKGQVILNLNDKLKRTLVSSVGKLSSIKEIAKSELSTLQDKLRMLILTDYIQKESVSKINSNEEFTSISCVSIFDSLNSLNINVNLGVLSGSLIILPNSIELDDIKYSKDKIEGTNYSIFDFKSQTNKAVSIVSKLFEQGKIQILIGTKSLLGEGWDSPCINSLILASFVGSFVLSNQMRGRAIRIDKNNPDKVSNIWHLVTLEPDYLFANNLKDKGLSYLNYDQDTLESYDYTILKRRFDTFIGPSYETDSLESGISRISIIKPPFTKEGISKINEATLNLSKNRLAIKDKWDSKVKNHDFSINIETDIPRENKIPVFTFYNFGLIMLLLAMESSLIYPLMFSLSKGNIIYQILTIGLMIIVAFILLTIFKKLIVHMNPARSMKSLGLALYKTLYECNLISSVCRLETNQDKNLLYVSMHLENASMHDQNIFNQALKELLSPIENPRYVIISKILNFYIYSLSFACPSIIGKKREYVECLAKHLSYNNYKFDIIYTYKENGRKFLLKCRKKSYLTFNEKIKDKKYKVSSID